MTEISPAAQAVYEAAWAAYWLKDAEHPADAELIAAAALHAAADQAEDVCPAQPYTEWGEGWLNGVQDVAAGLRRIANELEAQ